MSNSGGEYGVDDSKYTAASQAATEMYAVVKDDYNDTFYKPECGNCSTRRCTRAIDGGTLHSEMRPGEISIECVCTRDLP